jgi:hypothetical protein
MAGFELGVLTLLFVLLCDCFKAHTYLIDWKAAADSVKIWKLFYNKGSPDAKILSSTSLII